MPNWEEIRKEWETSNVTFKELADKYDIKDSTIRSRKNREKWQRDEATRNATKSATQRKNVATKRVGAPKGNSNAKGNKGGSAPKGNSNAVTHGFYQKHLPAEAFDIMTEIAQKDPLDMLWENIVIQHTAIVRAQRLMWVENESDHLDKESGYSCGESSSSTSYKIIYAHERQATFLQAQSRAMATLQSMIKQYDELCRTDMATEEQKARIAVLKAKIPNQDTANINDQITALADLINNPAPERVIDDG